MPAHLELVLDVVDLDRMVEFYVEALGYARHGSVAQYASIVPADGRPGLKLIFQRVEEPKTVKNRLHLDIRAPAMDTEAARLAALGAQHVKRFEEFGEAWILMRDPEGNELCVCQQAGS